MSTSYSLEKVEVALSPPQRFEEFLRSRGRRNTAPRRRILDQVFARHEHFDADWLIAELARADGGRHPGRATVYRTLRELVEAGLLREMQLGGRTVYEHDYGYPQHDHLYCQKCHQLIEFNSDEVRRIRDEVAREHRFRAQSHRLIVTGVCAACSRPKRPARSLDLI